MNFATAAELLAFCSEHDMAISEVMLRREIELAEATEAEINARMDRAWEIMKNAVHQSLETPVKSMGGLIGGEAKKINAHRLSGGSVCGALISKAVAYSMGVLEVNASMGLIVAAPTAGSSGVLPGVLLALQEEREISDEKIREALLNASAIGYLITRNATVSGAKGGCQAEVGSASAMAASAVVELMGGTPEQCLDAASFAIVNLLGLVCDPIGGLVEVPCQSRNATGASNALVAAEIVLSSVTFHVPLDETIDVMYQVGRSLPRELRETALGGLATAPSACRLCPGS